MLYRKMPKNGDMLSILGFGCMRLPVARDGRIDEFALFDRALSDADVGNLYQAALEEIRQPE